MSDFRAASEAAKKHKPLDHVHNAACTYEVCGVGPRRVDLIRSTLLRRLDHGGEFWHYKKSDVEAMR